MGLQSLQDPTRRARLATVTLNIPYMENNLSHEDIARSMREYDEKLTSGSEEEKEARFNAINEEIEQLNEEFKQKDPEGMKAGTQTNREGTRILQRLTQLAVDSEKLRRTLERFNKI